MKLAQKYRFNNLNHRQLKLNKILISRKVKLNQNKKLYIYLTFFLQNKKKARFLIGHKLPFLKMSSEQLLKEYNSYMSNTNKNSAMNLYQNLTELIAHFAKHKSTLMVQCMKAKLTLKECTMAAVLFFTQMERFTKGSLQEASVTEKGF